MTVYSHDGINIIVIRDNVHCIINFNLHFLINYIIISNIINIPNTMDWSNEMCVEFLKLYEQQQFIWNPKSSVNIQEFDFVVLGSFY